MPKIGMNSRILRPPEGAAAGRAASAGRDAALPERACERPATGLFSRSGEKIQ